MFSVRRRAAARLAAATLVTGLVASASIATAGTAFADGGATAKLGGLTNEAGRITITEKDGDTFTETGGLFTMRVDGGGNLFTYCIDLYTLAKTEYRYKEVGWDQSSLHNNPNAGKILWILENGYPEQKLADLNSKIGAQLTKGDAAAGTQAAIWTLSDGVEATPVDKDAKKLTDYLLEKAVKLEEPTASLSLSPSSVNGKSGEKLGPITVSSSKKDGAAISLAPGAPAGVKVVDDKGAPVTTAGDGSKLFLDVPAGTADGTAEVTASITTEVPLGRAFVSVDGPSQTLILAGSSASTVTAKAGAAWAKTGAIPAVTVAKDCAKGALEIIASNKGDEPWTFDLKGTSHTVAAGETKTISLPVGEDEAYDFTITGPNGFSENFKGVLDCKTAPSPEPSTSTPGTPSESPSTGTPAPSASTDASTGSTGTTGGDLAETGSSNATPMIAGIAVALVVLGGGAVFFLRRKKTAGH
ncbi:LAETG motif-containing sortase-dependent surface protein [Streptomyces termitum]|uniref:TQXA domain-containing protein n=1 Tax=Streptomyces termitum TaxID=67368 RepID=A0A918SSI8_9ACTN|nr:LAETG motif-containing sortase-dependent surface protein [Streptomyces termitum]GHA69718.1 TQXA domain-containing protein [Streptomyces termitum]